MDNEYYEMIHAVSHYPRALTLCGRGQNPSRISEDDKITVRLSPIRSIESDPAGPEDRGLTIDCPASQPDHIDARQSEKSVSEIDLHSLSAADQIVIETGQSVYVFTVTDPAVPSGRLIGGVLGNRLVDAHLLTPWVEGNDSTITPKSIKAGVKFNFVIEGGTCLQRLTTSEVRGLLHRKKIAAVTPLNRRRRVTLDQVSD